MPSKLKDILKRVTTSIAVQPPLDVATELPSTRAFFPKQASSLDPSVFLDVEGCLVLLEAHSSSAPVWVIDAEPPVMEFFARMFPRSLLAHAEHFSKASQRDFRMLWTHRPRSISDGFDTRRDLLWFLSRFPVFTKTADLRILQNGALDHAKLLAQTQLFFSGARQEELALERARLEALTFAIPLRPHQEIVGPLVWNNKGLLLADVVGLGKTASGLSVANREGGMPALVVCPPHLCRQWAREAKRFLPGASVHILQSGKIPAQGLPVAHFYITAYSRVHGLVDYVTTKNPQLKLGTIILDEVHEIRNAGTRKHDAVAAIAEKTSYRIGLSATPVMNYGVDAFNILAVLRPGSIGDKASFMREWCNFEQIREPKLFGSYLKKNGLLLRRTQEDIGRLPMDVTQVILSVDADLAALQAVDAEARNLALMVMANSFASSESRFKTERELNFKLRQATGIAKARAVAEVVRSIAQSGEQVLLYGWHKAVYEIWRNELSDLRPAFYNGDASDKDKAAAIESFQAGTARVLIMSLASGQGVDGLQRHACHVVFGELDWTPGRHEQCIGRLAREGQLHPVTATFVTVEDGSDPVMVQVLGLKKTESAMILTPDKVEIARELNDEEGHKRMKSLAEQYLIGKGERLPIEGEAISGHLADGLIQAPALAEGSFEERLIQLLRAHEFVSRDERLMGDQLEKLLKQEPLLNSVTKREVVISKTSRLDFLVGRHVIELKVNGASKKETYQQIKRYAQELGEQIDSIILLCPWRLSDFLIEKTIVRVVQSTKTLA